MRMERLPLEELDGAPGVAMSLLSPGTSAERVRVDVATLDAGACLPRHPSGREQVFHVVSGHGRVAGDDDVEQDNSVTQSGEVVPLYRGTCGGTPAPSTFAGMSGLGVGILASLVAAAILAALGWLTRLLARLLKARRSERAAFSTALAAAATDAPARVKACVDHNDPEWFGPDLAWQTSESMTRMADLGNVATELERLLPEAAERLPLSTAQEIKALRDLCRGGWADSTASEALHASERLSNNVRAAAHSRVGRTGTKRSLERKRRSDELDLLTNLRALVAKAKTMIADVIEYGDPVWHGPDNSWQTAESMGRMADLSAVPDRLVELAESAEGFGWLEVATTTRALASVARSAREGSGALAFNEEAVARVGNLAASLLKDLDGPHFAHLDTLAAGTWRSLGRPIAR